MTRKMKVQSVEAEPTDAIVERDPIVQLSEMPREQEAQIDSISEEGEKANEPDEMDTEELRAMFEKEDLTTSKPKSKKKQGEKAACDVCGKTMSAKSLKYKHSKTCRATPEVEEVEVEVALPVEVEAPPPPPP